MRLAIVCLIGLLAGCEDRRSFDERYDETANEIQDRTERIETDLNAVAPEAQNPH